MRTFVTLHGPKPRLKRSKDRVSWNCEDPIERYKRILAAEARGKQERALRRVAHDEIEATFTCEIYDPLCEEDDDLYGEWDSVLIDIPLGEEINRILRNVLAPARTA